MHSVEQIDWPWRHWIADDFLSPACLAELKSLTHDAPQVTTGRRRDNQRLFLGPQHIHQFPELTALYRRLDTGDLRAWFANHTGQDYRDLYLRIEVISDIGWFELEPHHDHLEKRLTAFVYTDHACLWPGTMLTHGHRIQSRDNRCFFFVPAADTYHSYPRTYFHTVRRCLQINYWTVPV